MFNTLLSDILQELKNSNISKDRILYIEIIKKFIDFNNRLLLLQKDELEKDIIKNNLEQLNNILKNYKIINY